MEKIKEKKADPISAKIQELEKQKEQLVANYNQVIGAIAVLKQLQE